MTRFSQLIASLALATLAACSASAYADQVEAPPAQRAAAATAIAIASAPDRIRAPYDVEILRENGDQLPTYAQKDRFYVQGNAGERYILRITNPTPNRVEAVVTVDGLDVIDGESGDLRKRGYIVPAYGETRVEGFRTSSQNVATFRFSAVDDSYAGRLGKARNVGVVAVAIFDEQAQQQIIEQAPPPPPGPYRYEEDLGEDSASRDPSPAPAAKHAAPRPTTVAKAPAAPPPAAESAPRGAGGASNGAVAPSPMPPRDVSYDRRRADKDDDGADAPTTGRLGLGTEYGENRYSATTFTRFERASQRPIAIAELRYNDAAGLTALGITVQPLPDEGELMTRETADPFPGDRGYARPPR